jgi:putative DNA primase/helicase
MTTNTKCAVPDFAAIAEVALEHFDTIVEDILGLEGEYRGKEFVTYDPTRSDAELGSFLINVESGDFCDFADPCACRGGGLSASATHTRNCRQGDEVVMTPHGRDEAVA